MYELGKFDGAGRRPPFVSKGGYITDEINSNNVDHKVLES